MADLHRSKDAIFQKLREALDEAGLHEYEIDSVRLYVKQGPKNKCEPGEVAVWMPVAGPGGTVVYQWVCTKR